MWKDEVICGKIAIFAVGFALDVCGRRGYLLGNIFKINDKDYISRQFGKRI